MKILRFAPLLTAGTLVMSLASTGFARELHWRSFEVDARLESDGTLSVSELQDMVFTGDWNGGERSFRLFAGQTLDFRGMARIDDSSGDERPLRRGSLDELNQWQMMSANVVRWRSRLPSDPVFRSTEIGYRLDYRLIGILQQGEERRYQLNHDFAFADRDGVIERIVVRLELAPEWRMTSPHPVSWESENLPPGQGFVVPIELEYTGEGAPRRATPPQLPGAARWGALALLIAGGLHFLRNWLRRDRALGRWAGSTGSTATHDSPIDRAWLEKNVFALAPEVVGAAWDRKVGSAEVAALLARLTAEGKLASEVKTTGRFLRRQDLHLTILVPRAEFSDYETPLIEALFGNATTTDTQSLRKRYKSTGFDPAAKIRGGLERRMKRIRGFASGSPKPQWRPTGMLLLGGLLLFIAVFFITPGERALILAVVIPFTIVFLTVGLGSALTAQGRVGRVTGPAIGLAVTTSFFAGGIWLLSGRAGATWLLLAAAVLWALGLTRSLFNMAATREGPDALAVRRDLRRARDYFSRELARPKPELEDSWFPYLLAFGLAPGVDRWFRRFGDAARSGAFGSGTAGGGIGGGSAGSGWSGGGGAFGGGGATATWAMAATAMSAGVAAPGSSGSGGGGGGGSSGGGGGGGW